MADDEATPRYTDYAKAVGTAGTMIIRDHGSAVEFIIACSDGATNSGGYTWSGVVNGVGVGGTVSLGAGFGSRSLGSWGVSTSQTVSFHQNATGTQGLGGAADHAAYIARGGIPPAPVMRPASEITTTSMLVQFDSQGDGGSPITSWLLERALDPAFSVELVQYSSTGTTRVEGLTPATTYYYRARGQNAYGVSGWASTMSAATLASIFVSDGTTWRPTPLYVDDGTTAKVAVVNVSDGAAWRVAG